MTVVYQPEFRSQPSRNEDLLHSARTQLKEEGRFFQTASRAKCSVDCRNLCGRLDTQCDLAIGGLHILQRGESPRRNELVRCFLFRLPVKDDAAQFYFVSFISFIIVRRIESRPPLYLTYFALA